jgi:hypothetical protein
MTTSNNNNIYPKSCVYNCNTQIYWNVATNEYWEVFTKKKHICPNRSKSVTQTTTKPKMSNSFELLQGPIADIQKKYEMLSDIVSEYKGKVHGSQRDRDPETGLLDLLVYYEVPEGKRDEVKQKFNNLIRNNIVLQKY